MQRNTLQQLLSEDWYKMAELLLQIRCMPCSQITLHAIRCVWVFVNPYSIFNSEGRLSTQELDHTEFICMICRLMSSAYFIQKL
jgi:hypothetical protein